MPRGTNCACRLTSVPSMVEFRGATARVAPASLRPASTGSPLNGEQRSQRAAVAEHRGGHRYSGHAGHNWRVRLRGRRLAGRGACGPIARARPARSRRWGSMRGPARAGRRRHQPRCRLGHRTPTTFARLRPRYRWGSPTRRRCPALPATRGPGPRRSQPRPAAGPAYEG